MYTRSISELFAEFSSGEQGISSAEAKKRLDKHGKNLLPKKQKASIWKLFLYELKDPIILLLLVAIIVSAVAREFVDAIAIAAIVLVDAAMGAYQANKANKTAEALDKLVQDSVKVCRDGQISEIPAEELVPGDYIYLESGDKVPADLRLVKTQNFSVDESILTGESLAVEKSEKTLKKAKLSLGEQLNMAFSGTAVVSGRAEALVVKTGLATELGKIADHLTTAEEEKSPLTIRIEKFSRQISIMVLVVALIISILLIVKGSSLESLLLTVIAFAVSALPEGLPLALTMALSIASNRMAKKQVIVRKLRSAESLGSCTVIASDKTGTLTVNEQTAKKILLPDGAAYDITGTGYELRGKILPEKGAELQKAKDLALLGVVNNEASISRRGKSGDSIDLAFLILGEKAILKTGDIEILQTIPYESENKFSAVFYARKGKIFCTVKGSFETILKFCNAGAKNTKKLEEQHETLARDGYRVIALASKEITSKEIASKETAARKDFSEKDLKNLDFAGMVGFIDPIRKEALSSIKKCHSAGVKVAMITGDHPLTALKIARDLNLASDEAQLATGDELEKVAKNDFDTFVASKTVFARVAPMQKLQIIESYKRQGEFVAVTGDGVNDTPALKSANIGVAMGSGADIARETADMIIADDNFRSIVHGVKEGRVAYANIRKVVFFLISCGLAEALFFFLSIAAGLDAPLLAVQLLWLNVITNGIQDFALSFEKAERDILKESPRSPDEAIFNRELIARILYSGVFIGLVVFMVWVYLVSIVRLDPATARGYILLLMVFMQNIHAFNSRSETQSAFKVPLKNNRMIVFGVLAALALQVLVSEIPFLAAILKTQPLSFGSVLQLFVIALSVLGAMEFYKYIARQQNRAKKKAP